MAVEKTACILCSRNCGLVVDVTDGKFAKIRGDDDHPVSKGYLCQKAARLTYYQHHDDRLTHPLRREPDGSFVRVTWDEALDDIAQRLVALRERHGGDAFAFVGGGGQGNHVGGAYSRQLLAAMRSRYAYNALGQEKTGDFWLNGRLFGRQDCHTTEDIEHADYVLVIGANPYQAHGIPNARDTLRDLKKDPARTLVVVDPRRSETAKFADLHLQVRPGADAYLMSAMLAIMLRDGLFDRAFIAQRCTGFEFVERVLRDVPIAEYARRADVPLEDIERVAHGFATARAACLRIDLGIQHTLHTTLNGYLEKLLFLLTGHFGKRGGNNLHSFLLPVIGHTDERAIRHGKPLKRTAHHRMFPIAGIYPPNILPDEIERAGEKRVRAAFVDSANPVVTYADTNAYERAFGKLELLVVIDVAMTETARLAHYVLPAASQFEKWEATGFNLEFPANAFHLRHPLLPPLGESLPEPEIYTRLLEKMGELPRRFPLLERIARFEPRASKHLAYLGALGIVLAANKKWQRHAASIVYRTLGRAPRRISRQSRDARHGALSRDSRAPLGDAHQRARIRRDVALHPPSGRSRAPAHPGDDRRAARARDRDAARRRLSVRADGGRAARVQREPDLSRSDVAQGRSARLAADSSGRRGGAGCRGRRQARVRVGDGQHRSRRRARR